MSKKIRIGTDVSLATCRNEGYLTMLVDKSDLDGPLDPEKYFVFGQCLPSYIDNNKFRPYYEDWASCVAAWKVYQEHKEEVDNACGMPERTYPKTVYELLGLVDDIDKCVSFLELKINK